MKSRYIFSLLVLGSVACFSPADAQTAKQTPKAKAKTTIKPAAKKTAAPVTKQKAAAKKLGDVAARSAAQDTTKKGGGNTPAADANKGGSLSEEIIVTTNYKPVLADAVKIRRNPDLEDKTPYKAPLTYTSLDKRLEQNTAIKQLEAAKLAAERDSILYNNYVKVGAGNLKLLSAKLTSITVKTKPCSLVPGPNTLARQGLMPASKTKAGKKLVCLVNPSGRITASVVALPITMAVTTFMAMRRKRRH